VKGKTLWLNMNTVTSIVECEDADEAKKILKRANFIEDLPPRSPDARPRGDGKVQYLSDMQAFAIKVAEGRFANKGELGYGTADGTRIRVNGNTYPNGLSVNPLSNGIASIKYRAGGKAHTFITGVALHDSASLGVPGGRIPTPLVFQVIGDGKTLWKSKPVDKAKEIQECKVGVAGVEILELRVNCPGENTNAQAVWLEPRLLLK
jgi:hypothetical protein